MNAMNTPNAADRDEPDTPDTPDAAGDSASLDALHARVEAGELEMAAFAAALAEYLRQGRQAEVGAFLAHCGSGCRQRLHQLPGAQAPWRHDAEVWLALARVSLPSGELFWGEGEVPPRSAALSAELRTLANAWLDGWRAQTHQPWRLRDGYDFVLRKVFLYLGYPGMPRDEAIELVRWALQLRGEAGLAPTAQYHCQWMGLLAQLSEDDLLMLAAEEDQLCRDIVLLLYPRQRQRPAAQRWAAWHGFFLERPALFDALRLQSPGLIAQRWAQADAACRTKLVQDFFKVLCNAEADDWPHDLPILAQLLQDDAAPFVAWLRELGHLAVTPEVVERLCAARLPALQALLLPICAAGCESGPQREAYAALAEALLAEDADALLSASATQLTHLLPALRAGTLARLLPQLGKASARSAAKGLRAALAQALAALPPDAPKTAGWLAKPNKHLLLAYRDVLIAHPDPAAAPLIAELLAGGLLDAVAAAPLEARLQALGQVPEGGGAAGGDAKANTNTHSEAHAENGVAGADALAALERQAATFKRFSPAITPFDQPALLDLLAPLSPQAARTLLHLAASAAAADVVLPALAQGLLAQAGAEGRARLALTLVEHWVAADGAPTARWGLRLLPGAADDRVVEPLAAAALAWHKARKERAVIALQQLGALDTPYALSRVQALITGRPLKPSVLAAAQAVLAEAAARRGMDVAELGDELTPDFGLGEGLTLRVDTQDYPVLLQGDLSLRLRTPAGKTVRSLPAPKDERLRPAWEAESARLKTLANGIKAVAKQQAPRLQTCLLLDHGWPVARWRRLFVDHALLRVMAQSLIWQADTPTGEALASFRIAEDLWLVDAQGDPVTLPDDARVALWHPARASAAECAAWRDSLADYQIRPLIAQLTAPAALPDAAHWDGELLRPGAARRLTQDALSGLMRQWGFQPGPVWDGPGIYWHEQLFPMRQWALELRHSAAMPYRAEGHQVVIEGFALRDIDADVLLPPAAWPLPLQAAAVAYWQTLDARHVDESDAQG